MRLIDAEEFKKQIAGMAIVNNYPADKANKMCELIDCQPTAYDVDKVIKDLEEYAHSDICGPCRSCRISDDIENIECENCGALGALEIVKNGGVHG
ncbi:MAG: hypothetical protein HFG92_13460 [Dorea sp.]|jgi:hypothetical protein|nr:hypothetical protein [Dorea sp.]